MNLFTFSLLLTLAIFSIGCNTENPLCTDNYCVEGEIYPRSELVGDFSLLAVDDSVIFATLVTGIQPVETTPVNPIQTPVGDSTTLADIVSDVASGGTRYSNKIVTIVGVVESAFESGTRTLVTNNDDVTFYIANRSDASLLAGYQEGKSYTFTLYIAGISTPDEDFDWYAVWGRLPKNNEINSVIFADIVSNVASGQNAHLSKFVKFTATVSNDASVFTTDDTISLSTNNSDVLFFVWNHTFPPKIMGKYKSGVSYTFTVFIEKISYSEEFDDFSVRSYIVKD